MARTPTETYNEHFTDADQNSTALMEIRQENNAVAAADAVIMDSFDVIKALGRIEAANFYETVSEKLIAETAINIRQGKQYKGLPYKDKDGNQKHVSDFEEFCEVFMGKTARRVNQLMLNYNTLGPELYEQAERLGFRQRDYNALKALPADDRAIIAQAIEAEDMDKALDLMQQMAAKHHREKETTEKQLEELAKSVDAKDAVIKGKSAELDKKNEQLARLQLDKSTDITEQYMPGHIQLTALQDYTRRLTSMVTATLNSEIIKLYNEFDGQPPKHIELAAAQALGLIITAAYGVAENVRVLPVFDPELAADDPAKADAEAFMAYQAAQTSQQKGDLIAESNRFNEESAEDWKHWED
jgi:hypothetical protein